MATKTEKDLHTLYLITCACGSLLISDDITSTVQFKHTSQAKRGKGAKKVEHVLRVAEEITLKNPEDEIGLVNHLFQILDIQPGITKVKLVGDILSPRWKDYLNSEGNRSV